MGNEEEVTPPEGATPPQDLSGLETQLGELVEVLNKDQEIKAEEKILNEETNSQSSADIAHIQSQLSALQENQTALSNAFTEQTAMLTAEMQTLNSNTLVLIEKTELQNGLITEGSFMITLTIIITLGLKIFIGQISKW